MCSERTAPTWSGKLTYLRQCRYSRIAEVLDLTPSYLHRGTSRSRHSLQRAVGGPNEVLQPNRPAGPSAGGASSDLAHWLTDGSRFFCMCLETVEQARHLQARNETLENENETLREEASRLRHRLTRSRQIAMTSLSPSMSSSVGSFPASIESSNVCFRC